MKSFQKDFIDLALECKALTFGEFTLKSGRVSPYFFNAGLFRTGADLAKLCDCYAQALIDSGVDVDMLFGPAYKGIPLAAGTAMAIHRLTGKSVDFAYNRKEAKTHGEGGSIVGGDLQQNTVIIDDVITAGTAIREVLDIFAEHERHPAAIIIGLDRQEKGQSEKSAIMELEDTADVKVISIITLLDIVEYLKQAADSSVLEKVEAYRSKYGVQ